MGPDPAEVKTNPGPTTPVSYVPCPRPRQSWLPLPDPSAASIHLLPPRPLSSASTCGRVSTGASTAGGEANPPPQPLCLTCPHPPVSTHPQSRELMREAGRPEGEGNGFTAFLRNPEWREVRGRESNLRSSFRSFSDPQSLPSPTQMLREHIFCVRSVPHRPAGSLFTEPWRLLPGDISWSFCSWLWPHSLCGGRTPSTPSPSPPTGSPRPWNCRAAQIVGQGSSHIQSHGPC